MPEVPHTLFISDLHLDGDRPDLVTAFRKWARGPARRAERLYILGDLFEAWIGDDDDASWIQVIADELHALTDAGIPVAFQHGNRDFLLGEAFCRRTGITLLDEACVVDLYKRPALLMHGDTLCTDDVSYQAFRRQVRDPAWQQTVLRQPLAERRHLANQLRNDSRAAQHQKSMSIMDVNDTAVDQAMSQHGVDLLIHGHTHRPARHRLGQSPCIERIVLGDWGPLGWQLRAEANGALHLESWPLDP